MYMRSFIEAQAENEAAGVHEFPSVPDKYLKNEKTFGKYIRILDGYKKGKRLPRGAVPFTPFWFVDAGTRTFIGQANVRHYLNDRLRSFGGHIGYAVRPRLWGKGYGTLLLSLLLPEAARVGIRVVRVTCFSENVGSAKVILRNGGIFLREVFHLINGEEKCVYVYDIHL
jgi:predicted acetyltransferase